MKRGPKIQKPWAQVLVDNLNRGMVADLARRKAKARRFRQLNSTVFPPGTRFFYSDFMPTVAIPRRGFFVFDPHEREIPAHVAIPTEPRRLTEDQFRRLTKQYNEPRRLLT